MKRSAWKLGQQMHRQHELRFEGRTVATRSVVYENLRLRSVLAATDLSPASDGALHHAISIARHYCAALYVVHVVSSLGCTLAGPEAIQLEFEAAEREMDCLAIRLRNSAQSQDLAIHFIVLKGNVDEELEGFAHENQVDLIVVGTHGRQGLEKVFFGSIAQSISRCCCCPVLTVGPHSPLKWDWAAFDNPSSLLYATAFQRASQRALSYAVSLANESKSQLTLLHVLSPYMERVRNRDHEPSGFQDRSAIQHLKNLIPPNAELKREAACIVEHGDPASSIVRVAARTRAAAIIMGSRLEHFSDLAARFLPSTIHRVSCEAKCPVLTIRS
jgi:nucleotide-binding universal stress UspA family protein